MIEAGDLTEHFDLDELLVTVQWDLMPEQRAGAALLMPELLAMARLLEEVRSLLGGAPIIVHSGFRCPLLNARTKGASRTSQHMLGQAADFHPRGVDLRLSWSMIARSPIQFGQLILEGDRQHPSWIHLSLGAPWRTHSNNQVLDLTAA